MLKSAIPAALAVIGSLMLAEHGAAHHNQIAIYDGNSQVEVRGKVTQFKFINPHATFLLEVVQNGQPVVYQFETHSAVAMARNGWTRDTLKPGSVVTVNADIGRRRKTMGFVNWVRLPDGRKIEISGLR